MEIRFSLLLTKHLCKVPWRLFSQQGEPFLNIVFTPRFKLSHLSHTRMWSFPHKTSRVSLEVALGKNKQRIPLQSASILCLLIDLKAARWNFTHQTHWMQYAGSSRQHVFLCVFFLPAWKEKRRHERAAAISACANDDNLRCNCQSATYAGTPSISALAWATAAACHMLACVCVCVALILTEMYIRGRRRHEIIFNVAANTALSLIGTNCLLRLHFEKMEVKLIEHVFNVHSKRMLGVFEAKLSKPN